MASVTLNGNTYSDDSNPSTGLANGGHRVRFVPALSDMLAEAGNAAASAAESAGYATQSSISADRAALSASAQNYLGAWASLTGPAATPASVSHRSRLWALTTALADITTAEPGVDARWLALGGIDPEQTIIFNFFLG